MDDRVTLWRWIGDGLPPGPWQVSPVTDAEAEHEVVRFAPLAELERLQKALRRIAEWDGPEEFLDDVEVELKAIAREALEAVPDA